LTQDHVAANDLIRRIAEHWPEVHPRVRPGVIYLYRARDLLLDDVEEILKPLNMRSSDLDVLAALRTQPEPWQLTPTELYRALLLSSGGLTKILHRLEAAGWIDRPANPADGRGRLVRLTRAGTRQLDKASQRVLEHEDRRMAVLSKKEQQELAQLLGKLVGAWEG
jgi:DNA-binding MarR family transcriptional regulator